MIGNLKIDQAATFAGVVFLSCQPKLKFGTQEQDRTKDGLAKWEVEVLGAVYTPFGGTSNEVIKVGMASSSNPAEGLTPFSPVQLGGLEVGVMEKTKKNPDGTERVIGVSVWFRAQELLNAAETVVASGKAA
jgi:hypothetical protein